jgi:hypothetical protein
MNQPATVIYFEIAGIKKYISETSTRPDNKILLVSYTDKVYNAHHFDPGTANNILTRIHNPHDRFFKTETINAPKAKINAYTQRGREALV